MFVSRIGEKSTAAILIIMLKVSIFFHSVMYFCIFFNLNQPRYPFVCPHSFFFQPSNCSELNLEVDSLSS